MIYCFSPGIPGNSSHVPQVGMLHYSDKDFAVAWAGPSLLPNNAWPVTAADTIYAGPAWDIRMPNLITLSNQGSTPAFTLGAAGWTGTAVQIVSIQTVPVPAWSPAGLANNAPYTPFGAFQNPDQQTIYTYLSQLFPAPGQTGPGPTTDVRSQYAINSNTTIWQNYGAAINAVQNPSQIPSSWLAPPPNNWTTLDWTTVVGTLFNECEEVVTIYSQYGNLVSSVEALWVYETQDIVIAGTSTQETGQDNPSPRNYWLGQIFVTGLWNFAANAGSFFPDSPMNAAAFRLFVSTLASLAGSGISYNPTQQPSMTVSNAYPLIINTSGKTIVNNSLNLSAIFRDPVKMSILSGLAANEWQFVSAFPTSMEQPFKTVDQVWMYQQLVPFYFSIQVYGPGTRLPSSGATYTLNNIGYVLQNQSGPFSASQFQATELYRILISTLGVNQKDFFLGNGGWAVIPRQIMT